MSHLKDIFRVFIYVTAGNTIGAAIFLTLFNHDFLFSYEFLWEFISIAAVCALGNMIFWSRREISKKQIKIRLVIHYVYDGLIVLGGAFLYGWVEIEDSWHILFLFFLYTAVYICITLTMFKNDKKTAQDMNSQLSKYNREEE